MDFAKHPSFRNDESLVQLEDFLLVIPYNSWYWAVLDFSGRGVAPNNLDMVEFERLVRENRRGVVMTWPELTSFSKTLDQTDDCLIVAVKDDIDTAIDLAQKDEFEKCEIVIIAFDSTEWSVWARDPRVMLKLADLPPPSHQMQHQIFRRGPATPL